MTVFLQFIHSSIPGLHGRPASAEKLFVTVLDLTVSLSLCLIMIGTQSILYDTPYLYLMAEEPSFLIVCWDSLLGEVR